MAATMVKCAKLGRELPGLDPETAEGRQAMKLATMIAGKEFAVPARSRSTVKLTVPIIRALCASFTCENFGMATPSPWNRFASARFQSSKIWWLIAVRSTT